MVVALKVVAVVGTKHSGKTTVIEHLVGELKRRGYHVGAIKEMVQIPTLDTPGKETDRYSVAGAEVIVAVPRGETVIFIKRRLSLAEMQPYLCGMDYAVLEGFESEKALPKIIAAKTCQEARQYCDNSAIAVSGLIAESDAEAAEVSTLKLPVFSGTSQTRKLADLVEQKAVEF